MPFKRGTAFCFNALDVNRGSCIPKASPTGVTDPHLMAFFAIELAQGGNLRFSNLHLTQLIKQPQLGAPGCWLAKTVQCEGAVRCSGNLAAKFYGCNRAAMCAAHKDGFCVPCQAAEELEGGEQEEVVWLLEDPNAVCIEQRAQCLLPVGTTTGHFVLLGWQNRREVPAPLTNEELRRVAGHPGQCPLARVCQRKALPWPSL